jgi:hypothetical protein
MMKQLMFALAIGLHIFLGVIYGMFYHDLSGEGFVDVSIKTRDVPGVADIRLERRESYLLKIYGDAIPEVVTWNKERIVHAFYRPRKKIREFYYWITPPQVLTQVPNRLEILPHERFTFRIKNNVAASEFGNIVFRPSNTKKLPRSLVLIATVTILLATGLSVTWAIKRFLHIPPTKVLLGYALSHLPCFFLFGFLSFLGRFFKLEFILRPISFFGIYLLFIILIQIPIVLYFILRELRPLLVMQGRRLNDTWIFHWWRAQSVQNKFLYAGIAFCGMSVLMFSFRLFLFAEFFANFAFIGFIITTILALRNRRWES